MGIGIAEKIDSVTLSPSPLILDRFAPLRIALSPFALCHSERSDLSRRSREESQGKLREEAHGKLREEAHGKLREEAHGKLREEAHGKLREESLRCGVAALPPGPQSESVIGRTPSACLLLIPKHFLALLPLAPGGRSAHQAGAVSLFPVKQGLRKMRAMLSALRFATMGFVQPNNSR
ncbi:MAG: hypothetical protein ACRD22_11805 [Terriglobia bacterium]